MIGGAIFKGINQEATVDRSAAALGLSEADSERLGSAAGQVYASTFVGSLEEGTAVVQQVWRSFGDIGDEEMGRVAEGAAGLSSVFDVDVNQVIGAAQQLFEEGLAPSAEAALDTVATGLRDSKGPADEALSSINEYSTFYSQLGLNAGNVLGGLTSEFANNQFAIDKTGDAIKELAVRSVDGSTATAEALGNIGLSAGDVNAAFAEGGPAAEAMTERIISSITSIEDPAERTQTGVALMGAPFEDLGDNAVPILEDVVSGMGDVEGAAASVGDQASDNIQGVLTEAWRTVSQEVVTGIGDEALPIVRDFSDWVKDSVPDIVDKIGDLFGAFSEGDGVIDGVLSVFDELTGGGGIGSIFEKVRDIVQTAFTDIVDWLASGGIEMIFNALLGARQRLLDAALKLFPAILDALIQFLPSLLSFITGSLIPAILDFIISGVPLLLKTAQELFTTLIDAVVQILPGLLDTLLGTVLPNLLTTILGMIPQLLTTAIELFMSLIDAVVEILPDLLGTLLGEVLPQLLTTILGMIPNLLTTAVELFMSLIDAVIDVLPVLLTTLLVDVLPKLLTTILDMIPELIVAAIDAFLALVTGLLEVLPDLVTTLLVDVLPEIITTLIGMIPQLIETGITVFVALVDALIDAIPEITEAIILDLIPAIVEAVLGMGSQLYDAGVEVLEELLGGIKDKAGEVIGWVETNVVDKITDLWPFSPAKAGPLRRFPPEKAGENIMGMFAKGIAKGGAEAVRAASQSMEGLVPTGNLGGMGPRGLAAGAGGMGNVTFDVTVAVNGEMTRDAAQQAGRTMAEEARRELDRLSRARVAR